MMWIAAESNRQANQHLKPNNNIYSRASVILLLLSTSAKEGSCAPQRVPRFQVITQCGVSRNN